MVASKTVFARLTLPVLLAAALAPFASWSQTVTEKAQPAPAAPAVSTQSLPATPSQAQSPAPVAGAKSFLWEVKSKTNTIYLFGTVHVGKNSFYPLPDLVEKAFNDSAKLAVEADITNQQAIADAAPLMMYAPPATVENHVSPAVAQRLKRYAEANQMPYDALKGLKPFLLGGLLALTEFAKLGYDQRFGVEGYLIQKAVIKAKPIVELESVGEQMKLLSGLNKQEQEAFLENALAMVEKGKAAAQIESMIAAWQAGDAAGLEETVKRANEGMKLTAALDEKVLYGRNVKMAVKIDEYLKGAESHFVAVGSMHLVGKRGLVELMKAKGYEVKQL
jgi:uncharacterized protein YbaP (TraB family)